MPVLAEGFSARPETVPGLAAALPAGAAVALVPDRAAAQAAVPGQMAAPDAQDWGRSSGKTQLAAAFAESLWQSGGVDLLVWVEATSRASVLSGYAAATAAATGRDQASSCESVAAQFLSWLGETSRSWLVVLDDLADPANLDGLWPAGPAGRVLVTSADAAAVPAGMRVVPVGPFSLREAISYLSGRLAADPDKRLGAIELAQDLDFEPVALAQASAVIANSPLSCREYRAHFVRRREQLADSSSARPSAAAVTWTFSFERADQLAPGGSAQLLLALAALLDGHGIPETVLTAPAAGDFLAGGGGVPAGSERARAALAALEQVGLLTVEPVTAPPTVRISPVLQAALRAAMPEGMPDQAARSVADALLQAWPEQELPGWPASGLRSCVAALRRITGDRLWDGGCHPVLVRAGDSLDRARLTGPAVDHWRDLATTSGRLLGGGHPDTMLAGQRLADAYLAAGRAADAIPWFQWVLDSLTHKLGPDHRDVIEARRRLGHALVAALQFPAAITVLERAVAPIRAGLRARACRHARRAGRARRRLPGCGPVLRRHHPLPAHAGRPGARPGSPAPADDDYASRPGRLLPGQRPGKGGSRGLQAGGGRPGARPWARSPGHAYRRGTTSAPPTRRRARRRRRSWPASRPGPGSSGCSAPVTLIRCEAVRGWPRCTASSGAMATPARCCATRSTAWSASCPMAIR